MATDLTAALARLLSDDSLRRDFARDPASVARALDVAEPHRAAFCSIRAEQLDTQAGVLLGKRFHEVAVLLPRTIQRIGNVARELFRTYAETFWPTGHRRHIEDAVAFGRFIARRNRAFIDVVEFNRLCFLISGRRVRLHFAGVRVPGTRPRRAVQVLCRTPSDVRSWLLYLDA